MDSSQARSCNNVSSLLIFNSNLNQAIFYGKENFSKSLTSSYRWEQRQLNMLSKLDRLAYPSMSARFNMIFIYYGIFKDVCPDWSVPVHDHSLVTRTNKLYIGSYTSPFYRIPNKPKNMSISGRHRVKIRVGRYVCFKNLFE